MADWAQSPGPKALARFGCRRDYDGHYLVPSESIIRDVLVRVDPEALDHALQHWNAAFGQSIVPFTGTMRVLPSTARPCATPSTHKASRPM